MPGVLLFTLTHDPDFVHYSSELLATSFLVIFLYGLNVFFKTNKKYFIFGHDLIRFDFFFKNTNCYYSNCISFIDKFLFFLKKLQNTFCLASFLHLFY